MASLSPTEIRQYCYDHLDVESTEVPSTVLDIFMSAGYNEIVGYFDDSPSWLHVTYTFQTVASQAEYDLDTTVGLTDPTALQTIADVRGPRWQLTPKSHRQMRDEWRQESASVATPSSWSQFGRSLWLWAAPTSAETYTITGTRKPKDWLSVNDVPDCPEEFHRLIADYTLGRLYGQQDDPEMAQLYLNSFKPALANLAKRYYDGTKAQPVVVNGGKRRDLWRNEKALGPLIYPFEDWRTWLQ